MRPLISKAAQAAKVGILQSAVGRGAAPVSRKFEALNKFADLLPRSRAMSTNSQILAATVNILTDLKNSHQIVQSAQISTHNRTLNGFHIPPDVLSEFRKKFDAVEVKIKEHEAMNHEFFEYLQKQSSEGFTAEQFDVFRVNFLARTQLTMPSVAKALAAAAMAGDWQAVSETLRNLNDEAGFGDPDKMHASMLMNCLNIHAMRVFNLDPILNMEQVLNSPHLLNSVKEYREMKDGAFRKPYSYIAGNTMAHELAADGMLIEFCESLFANYKGNYIEPDFKGEDGQLKLSNKDRSKPLPTLDNTTSGVEAKHVSLEQRGSEARVDFDLSLLDTSGQLSFDKMMEFFLAHRDDDKEGGNVEEQHGKMARDAAERACLISPEGIMERIKEVLAGAIDFLDAQAKVWKDMMGAMIQIKEVAGGEVIKPINIDKEKPNEQGGVKVRGAAQVVDKDKDKGGDGNSR